MLFDLDNREHPDPIPERVGVGMFTDRETQMDFLMNWVDMVGQKIGRSRALISHRRHGKTAIMERLYNRVFWERDDVMPFYYELSRDPRWIYHFTEDYLRSFLQQFLAYRTRDTTLAFQQNLSLKQISSLAEENNEPLVLETLDYWYSIEDLNDLSHLTRTFRDTPRIFAARTGLSIIVMFDEFQRLDQVLYYDEALTRQCHPYAQSFSIAAESSRAPMLIAGSEVSVLRQKALAGAMIGRVSKRSIKRLPLEGAAKLVLKFAQRQKLDISMDLAYTISSLVDGHPYYIWALFNSNNIESNLTTEEGIKKALTFEIEDRDGYINDFWRYNFVQNIETFNSPHAKEIMFYLTQYQESEVRVEQIVEALKLPLSLEEANQKMRELLWADLVREESGTVYGGLTDPMLSRVLRIEYGWEIQELGRDEALEQIQAEFTQEMLDAKDELIASLRGELSSWIGRFAEMFIEKLMKRFFKGQTVEGSLYFNTSGEICLSHFSRVYNTITQPEGAPNPYQIDLYGLPSNHQPTQPTTTPPWIVEIKNRQKPTSKPQVEHFWQAAQNLAEERGHEQFICWFYSRSGFTTPAQEFLQEKDILYTDHDGLTQLLQDLQVVEKWRGEL